MATYMRTISTNTVIALDGQILDTTTTVSGAENEKERKENQHANMTD